MIKLKHAKTSTKERLLKTLKKYYGNYIGLNFKLITRANFNNFVITFNS